MPIQQVIAIVIIIAFVVRLFGQKKSKNINTQEFYLWLSFWILSAAVVLVLPQIDFLVGRLGFSASGIEFLFYLAIVILFYFIFKLRLRVAKMEKDITTIVTKIAINKK